MSYNFNDGRNGPFIPIRDTERDHVTRLEWVRYKISDCRDWISDFDSASEMDNNSEDIRQMSSTLAPHGPREFFELNF